jgi:hypothetical protein
MGDQYSTADHRNRIVYDPWYVETRTGQPGQFKAMPYADRRYGTVDIEKSDLDETLERIAALADWAGKLRSDVLAELEALRQQSPERRPAP